MMQNSQNPKLWPRLCLRGALLAVLLALYLLCPGQTSFHSHWSNGVSWLNTMTLIFARNICFGPACWGAAVFLLLGCGDAWLRRKGVAVRVPGAARMAAAVLACVLLATGAYWTWGFVCRLSALPPMPFELGYFIMNHPMVMGVWWCVCALALHVALLRSAASGKG